MQQTDTKRATLTIPEIAECLGISRSAAYALATRSALPVPTIRLGRRMVVSRQSIERLLASGSSEDPTAHDVEAVGQVRVPLEEPES
jgi:predicted DNA-binding transcriptional regulator AlpA